MVANALLIRWTGGSSWVEDAPSIALYGRQERALKLPGITSQDQAEEVGQAVLALRAAPRAQTSASTIPTTEAEEAFTGYNVGDLVTAPGPSGSPANLRVRSITFTESDVGDPVFSPELGDRIDELEDALNRFLEKFGTAPATENGSGSGGDSSAYGGSDPGGYDIPAIEPEPVPEVDPWVDPTITDPAVTGGTFEDPTITDPNIEGTAVVNHVVVPPPDTGEDPSPGLEVGEGRTTILDGPVEIGDAMVIKRDGSVDIGDAVVYSRGASASASAANAVGLLWDGAKGLIGRLSGGAGTSAVAIDQNGDWTFGIDGINRPTVDFTNADVLGLGGGCIDTTTAGDSGVYVDCTPASTAANIVQFGRSGDVSTTGIPTKGGYILGTGAAGGGSFEVGANNSSSGNYCYIAGNAGSGYLDIFAEDFIQIHSNSSLLLFNQLHPGTSATFEWYFDYDGSIWEIVDSSNSANRWQISN